MHAFYCNKLKIAKVLASLFNVSQCRKKKLQNTKYIYIYIKSLITIKRINAINVDFGRNLNDLKLVGIHILEKKGNGPSQKLFGSKFNKSWPL